MKVFNMVSEDIQSYNTISNNFLDNMPSEFMETESIIDADILFSVGHQNATSIGGIDFNNPWAFRGVEKFDSILKSLDKPRVQYIVAGNMSTDYKEFNLRDIDFPCAASKMPEHPNVTQSCVVDSSLFHRKSRNVRNKNSVILFIHAFDIEIFREVLKVNKDIRLTVTGSNGISDEDANSFGDDIDRIVFKNLDYPVGVCNELNKHEFVISTETNVGIELMGVEGGFCGCQPIYPDVDYYNENVFSDSGVRYFDINNPVESISDIINDGYNWPEKYEAFVDKFDAKINMPVFWETVKQKTANYSKSN